MAKDDVFEEGKQVEDYLGDPDLVNELNELVIEPEANPDAEQRLETVVESPVRNEKKKPEPKPPVPQASMPKEPIVPPPVEQPKAPEPIPEQPQVQQEFTSLDDYINSTAEAVKQQWRSNAYRTLIGVVTGQLQVIQPQSQLPPQQQVQQTQPQQQERIVVKDNSEAVGLLRGEVDRIEMEIIDSVSDTDLRLLQAEKRLLKKQIMKLEGTYVEQPEIERLVAPVSSKMANPKEKKGGNISPKVGLAVTALVLVGCIGLVLLINSLWH